MQYCSQYSNVHSSRIACYSVLQTLQICNQNLPFIVCGCERLLLSCIVQGCTIYCAGLYNVLFRAVKHFAGVYNICSLCCKLLGPIGCGVLKETPCPVLVLCCLNSGSFVCRPVLRMSAACVAGWHQTTIHAASFSQRMKIAFLVMSWRCVYW